MSTPDPNIFNLENTAKIHALCQIPAEARNKSWTVSFLQFLPTASMTCGDPQIFTGPDGLPYFALNIPKQGQSFESYSLVHVLNYVTDSGVGIAINPSVDRAPDWVFSYGDLWNFRQTGQFIPETPRFANSTGADQSGEVKEARPVLIGQPNNELLPDYVRKALDHTLRNHFKIELPSVFLMIDEGLNPKQNLVFNVFERNFADPQEFAFAKNYLSWALPRDYGLIGIDPDSDLAQHFAALVATN